MAGTSRRTGGTPATVLLEAEGVAFALHAYHHDPRARAYGEVAAAALGLDPDRVLKTLLADLDGELVVGIVPVSTLLDLKALARLLGGSKAVMADVAAAERATGYVTGGISPLGQRKKHRTVLEETAGLWDTVFVSAGRRGLDLEIAPDDLVRLTDAVVGDISRS